MKNTHLNHTLELLSIMLLTCQPTTSHLTGMGPWLDKCSVVCKFWIDSALHGHCKQFSCPCILNITLSFHKLKNYKLKQHYLICYYNKRLKFCYFQGINHILWKGEFWYKDNIHISHNWIKSDRSSWRVNNEIKIIKFQFVDQVLQH